MATTTITKDTLGVEIELTCEPEDTNPADDFDDAATLAWVRDQIASGNEWAWFLAHVRVTYRDIVSDQYLGGCNKGNAIGRWELS